MSMTFKEILPSRVRSNVYMGDKVKIGFPILQGRQQLVIVFGRGVADKIGVSGGDKVRLFVEESNPLIWQLKKGGLSSGWKLVDINKKKSGEPVYKLQLAWNQAIPKGFEDKKNRFVKHDVYDSGIRIYIPGAGEIEESLE